MSLSRKNFIKQLIKENDMKSEKSGRWNSIETVKKSHPQHTPMIQGVIE